MKRLKGYTLVELIVVIGIILILAAILFPVMQYAKKQVRKKECAANLHQIGIALNFYIQDYNWHIPIDDGEHRSTIDENKAITLFAKSLRSGKNKFSVTCPLNGSSYNFPFEKFNSNPSDSRVAIAECTDTGHAKPESMKAIFDGGAVLADGLMHPTRLCVTLNVKDPSSIKVDFMEHPFKFNITPH